MKKSLVLMSSYPERECGIATFSNDLVNAISTQFGHQLEVVVCALENGVKKRNYPKEVRYCLDAENKAAYKQMARTINASPEIEMAVIQHEFGLFGGDFGTYLLRFVSKLKKPYLITYHTVLPNPCNMRKHVVRELSCGAFASVTMTMHAQNLLINDYGLKREQIQLIPHGSHPVEVKDKEALKTFYGYSDDIVLSTFGLIGPNKGIETSLYALPELVEAYPNIRFLVVGKTHPEIVKNEGEAYREQLEGIVEDLDLGEHVVFINQFLATDTLLEYLQMTDVYLFTSRDPLQAVSGTFTYALSCGCPIVATAIPHTKEMLHEPCGKLIDMDDSTALKDAVFELLAHRVDLDHMKVNALHLSKSNEWANSSVKYTKVISEALNHDFSVQLPPLTLKHLIHLTHDLGVIQFCKLSEPDLHSGYTLDDNARALVLACDYLQSKEDRMLTVLIDKYLRFLARCQQEDGTFVNYISIQGAVLEKNRTTNLEDSNGRAIWALGRVLSISEWLPESLVKKAQNLLEFAFPTLQSMESPRAIAFSMKGLHHYVSRYHHAPSDAMFRKLGFKLLNMYHENRSEKWHWFEKRMTYGNSILPEALMYAYLNNGESVFLEGATETFHFLLNHIFRNGYIQVIPNESWYSESDLVCSLKGGEQPIDVCYTVLTLDLFHRVTGNPFYQRRKEQAFQWFFGQNHLRQFIYNPLTGGCHDGLEAENVNLNQGAESTICYLLARLAMQNELHNQAHINRWQTEKDTRNNQAFEKEKQPIQTAYVNVI
jgi:glycosyltransferase involved in cell wall biosynthesis